MFTYPFVLTNEVLRPNPIKCPTTRHRGTTGLGAVLLALLLASAVVVLANSYLDGRYVHVEVRFVQTGLAKAGLLKVEVDCSGPFATPRPGRIGTVDLGWLRRTDLITIQAVRGGEARS